MAQVWYSNPEFKIEVGSYTWTNDQALSVIVNRPENAVSSATIIANDYQGRNYLTEITNLDVLKVYYRYSDSTSTWTQVFQGEVESIQPQLSMEGEVLAATCRGVGWPLVDMRVFDEYGTGSTNPTIDTVAEIISNLVTEFVNKSYGGGASGHGLVLEMSLTGLNPSLTYLPLPFKTVLDSLKILCDIATAYAATANAGPHFMVTPASKLHVATIGAHDAPYFDTRWPTWWRTDQAGSTLVEGLDFVNYSFQDNVKNYFNHIIYAGNLLKPGKGDFCENNAADWAVYGTGGSRSVTNDNATFKVGAYSIKAQATGAAVGGSDLYIRYKSGVDWGYDAGSWGGEKAHPTINFWLRRDANIRQDMYMRINDAGAVYAAARKLSLPNANEWYGFSFEIGPYGHISDSDGNDWFYSGGFDWSTVDWVYFFGLVNATPCNYWVDGFNFQGQIIRAAKDAVKIGNDTERQNYFFDSVGKDDSTKSGTPGTTDLGYMARLCKAELLRSAKKPIVGHFTMLGTPDLLPGQLLHLHANEKSDSTFNVDADYRVVNLRHVFTRKPQPFSTEVAVTNDVKNSIVNRPYSMANLIVNQLLGKDRESINLKSMNIDLTTPMLTETYVT